MIRCLVFIFGCVVTFSVLRADSALDLLGGFDEARIEATFPPRNEEALGDLAKVIYRLQSVAEESLRTRLGESSPANLGDAVEVTGELQRVAAVPIPESLIEFLEFEQLYLADVMTQQGPCRLFSASFPPDAREGDRISGLGVVIELNSEGRWYVMAAPRIQWKPSTAAKIGWQMLGEADFDVTLLSDVQQRSRQPLLADDGDAFYTLMAAANRIGDSTDNPDPAKPASVELLKRSEELTGDWMSLVMETVQITRIVVSEPRRQSQLGQDYYYQIDAVVDLGGVVVKINRRDPSSGPPVIFQNRYPVSVVTAEIPDFLKQRIRAQEGGDAVVSQHRSLIEVDGFFYRLWSYQSEFMNQQGGGDQFGPLIVSAQITDLSPTSDDPAGVQIIGWFAATAVIVGILFFWLWSRLSTVRDRRAKTQRQDREAEHVQLPTE
ncbi:MAG: hypothetical protein AAGG48_03985 [Planctomycetota bacterium]